MEALRMRVSMSAMGSVIMGSPARLDHAGDLPAEREEPETNPAELELSVVAASTAAHLATVPVADGELGPAIEFRELRSTRHWSSSSTCVLCLGRPERHPEMLQEGAPLLVGLGRGHEADVQ